VGSGGGLRQARARRSGCVGRPSRATRQRLSVPPAGPQVLDFFGDGSNTLGFAALDSSGRAVFTFITGQVVRKGRTRSTVLPRGIHHLTVSYTGDGIFADSVSAPLDLTVV
jgi:hypothetical protein